MWLDGLGWGRNKVLGQSGILTLTAALIRGQLVPRVTAALVAAQGVEAPLLTAPTVGPRALIHFCQSEGKGVSDSQARARVLPPASA